MLDLRDDLAFQPVDQKGRGRSQKQRTDAQDQEIIRPGPRDHNKGSVTKHLLFVSLGHLIILRN